MHGVIGHVRKALAGPRGVETVAWRDPRGPAWAGLPVPPAWRRVLPFVAGAHVVCVLLALLCTGTAAQAQEPAGDVGGFTRLGSFPTFEPYEHFDAQQARVILRFTDLVLPGHRGRDLRIERTLSNETSRSPAEWHWGIAGIPLSVTNGTYRSYVVDVEGLNHALLTYGPQLVMADGGTRQLYFETLPHPTPDPHDRDPSWRYFLSTDRWRYDAVEHRLYLPDGAVCDYSRGNTLTACWDAFGPFLAVDAAGIHQILAGTIEQPVEERLITFSTSGSGGHVSQQMSYLDRTWTLTRTPTQATFEGPTGLVTTFAFQSHPSSVEPFGGTELLTQITTPAGATIAYAYAEQVIHPFPNPEGDEGPGVSLGWLLQSRTVGGADVPTGTWTFGYEFADGLDSPQFVTVTAPASGGAVPATTEYLNWRGALFGEGQAGVLVGPARVTGRQRTLFAGFAQRTTDLSHTWARLATYQTWWGELPLSVLVPHVTTTTVCYPPSATCATATQTRDQYDTFQNAERLTDSSTALPGVVRVTQTAYLNQTDPSGPYLIGRPTTQTVTVGSDAVTSTRLYDTTTGFVTSATVAGVTTTFAPDPAGTGNVGTATVAPGTPYQQVTTMTYDWGVEQAVTIAPATDVARTIHRAINPDGTVASETEGAGSAHARTTQYTYDALGRVASVLPPANGEPTQVTYDNQAQRWVRTTRGTAQVETTLDAWGRAVRTQSGTTSAYLTQAVTQYDVEGRVSFEGLPVAAGAALQPGTTYVYDALNGVVTATGADGSTRTRLQGVVVDGAAQRVTTTVVDEEGRSTVAVHHGLGDPEAAPVGRLVDAAGQPWVYTYDALSGALTEVAGPDNVVRAWTYTAGTKRLDTERHPESGTVRYTDYLPTGRLWKKTDAKGTPFVYAYDASGRLRTVTAGTGPSQTTTTYTYESGSDTLVQVDAAGLATTFTYDDAGHLRGRVDTIDATAVFETRYDYDASDNLTQITYPDGRVVRYGYDGASRLVAVCRAGVSVCNEHTPRAETYATAFSYHPSGALAGYTAGNGLTLALSYDDQTQRLRTLTGTGATDTLDLTYSYDRVGNVTRIADGTRPQWTQAFPVYDALDRLVTATAPAYGPLQYTYDAHGNRQSGNGVAYHYATGNPFRLQQIGDGPTLTYDDNGNLGGIPNGPFVYAYTHDNQLQRATVDGVTTHYTYDADQWRIKKVVGSQAPIYSVRGPNGELLSEWANDSPAATVRDYIYAGGRLIGVMTTHQSPK